MKITEFEMVKAGKQSHIYPQSGPQIHHFLQLVCCSLTLPHTFTRPSSYFRITPLTQTTALSLTQTFFGFHKPSDNLSGFTAEHIYHAPQPVNICDLNWASSMCVQSVRLHCKCLCMTCLPSQNQICYFHHFCEEKQI